MLVLARKLQEQIIISNGIDEIIITVCEIDNNYKVKLGFEANRSWKIYRKEIWKQIQAQTQKS